MRIKEKTFREGADAIEVSAAIDDFRLWYRFPKSYPVSRSGDPFLAAGLLPAMLKGETLDVDPALPVSPKLLDNIPRLQEIHHCWNPALKIVAIRARASPAEPVSRGAFSFYSGGVDASFTFLNHSEEIGHLVFINGFDFSVDSETFKTAVLRHTCFAREVGKTLLPVETNHDSFGYRHNLSRVLTQGSMLASVALLLGFSRAYIPASDHYSFLPPLGTHPLTDPLYSNEWTEIVHDGAAALRVDKVIKVAECRPALANLTVCIEDMNRNCGRCIKCLRTMITLRTLGVTGAPFPPLPSLRAVRGMSWSGVSEPLFIRQNADLAARKDDRELERALRARLRRFERIRLLKDVDRVLLGGIVKGIAKRLRGPALPARRVTVTPPID